MTYKSLPLLLLLASNAAHASSAPFSCSVKAGADAPLVMELNNMWTIVDFLENNMTLSANGGTQVSAACLAAGNLAGPTLARGVALDDLALDFKIFGKPVFSIQKTPAGGTLTSVGGLNITLTNDEIPRGPDDLAQIFKEIISKERTFLAKVYTEISQIYQNSPAGVLAGNPFSALSTRIDFDTTLALVAKSRRTGWITPSLSNSALELTSSSLLEKEDPQTFNTISVSGQYTNLKDGSLGLKSYSLPLAYVMDLSWVPGMKWINDAIYRYSTVDNDFSCTTLHTFSTGTGLSIPFGSFTLMPYLSCGGGLSTGFPDGGFLWTGSLTATYDIAVGPGNLTVLALAGYGASIVFEPSKFLPEGKVKDMIKGLIADPKLSSHHMKAGVNYVFPVNQNLFVEALAHHTQFFEGSKLYVTRMEEVGLNVGLISSEDSPLGIKGGASYISSDHHKGFMINLTVTF